MHTCQGCSKQLASPQSLWNHKQRCERYDPPADLLEVRIGEKRKADGKYSMLSDKRFPSMVVPPSTKGPRTKGDIVGYSDDDGDVCQEKSKFDDARKANTLAIHSIES